MKNLTIEKYGPWILIVGSAEGLGEAFSRYFASKGFNLAMVDIRESKLNQLADEIEKERGVQTLRVVTDLTSPQANDEILAKIKSIDCGMIVYVAARSMIAPFLSLTRDDLDDFIELNCRNQLMLVFSFAKKLKKRGGGGIFLMSSLSGLMGMQLVPVYAATKAFTWNLAEGLSHELKKYNVEVMSCIAGTVSTPAYKNSNPGKSMFVPSAMEPYKVVEAAMKRFGARTLFIPGFFNRMSYFILLRLMPRAIASRIANSSMVKLYRNKAETK